jgi:ABC-type uncharacterized transport system permease subunit
MVAVSPACYIERMVSTIVLGISSLIALLPSAVLAGSGRSGRGDFLYWLFIVVAVIGQVAWSFVSLSDHWHTGISAALWITITATVVLFAVLAGVTRQGWRLTPLLMPYLAIVGLLALSLRGAVGRPLVDTIRDPWLIAHITLSVTAYAVLTIAAIAGVGVLLQEHALKRKRPTGLTHVLPSVADGETLQVGLLSVCEGILLLGILTGIATGYRMTGAILSIDHKTLLSLLAFVLVGLLLGAHYRAGVRGRGAARWILAAYLLLTLAYPGVKFVTDILVA